MTLTHRRHQRAVGQGFFHTADLVAENGDTFNYVYDCGAMPMYAAQRDATITEYVTDIEKVGGKIDLLFISHTHQDHISGLPRLLDKKNGLQVDTIILPLINVADRLFAYTRSAVEDPVSATDEFFRDFVVNPRAALDRFEPRQIVFVERGSDEGDGGAPGSRDDDDSDPDGSPILDIVPGGFRDGGIPWKLIGRGKARRIQARARLGRGTPDRPQAATIDDTHAVVLGAGEACVEWMLAPYVDPVVKSHEQGFIRELSQALGLTPKQLKAKLNVGSYVRDLLIKRLPELNAAYSVVKKDFNVLSLCLYSGPKELGSGASTTYAAQLGGIALKEAAEAKIAWIGTGDAALAMQSRANAFEAHYGILLQHVGSLTLPHHGSDGNHNKSLIEKIDARANIAAADSYSNWKHPGTKVVQCVASMGRFLPVVTSNPKSEVREDVKVACEGKAKS